MKILDHFEEWAMSLMLLAMTTLAFMQVVRRYMFSTGYPWTLEVTMICFACMIFLGISYGVRVGAHIGVDALVNLMSPVTRRYVSILAVVLSLVYVSFILAGSWTYVSKMMEVGIEFDDLPLERWKVLIVMPIGYAMVALRFAQLLWALLTGSATSLRLAYEAADALKMKVEEAKS